MTDASVAVVTIAAGRREHLALQARSLSRQDGDLDRYVVVDLGGDDPTPCFVDGPRAIVVSQPSSGDLPLARARNVGAAVADADVIVFLDVDCIADESLVRRYRDLCIRRPGVHAGPVGYLPEQAPSTIDTDELGRFARYQPGRPMPTTRLHRTERIDLFWSLSFAVDRASWRRIGGFDQRYVGYGGEDTDFARRVDARGVPIWFSGGPRAFHQWHEVDSPPVRHLESICRNAQIFHDRWGAWPMVGWLAEFASRNLIEWAPDGDRCIMRRPCRQSVAANSSGPCCRADSGE